MLDAQVPADGVAQLLVVQPAGGGRTRLSRGQGGGHGGKDTSVCQISRRAVNRASEQRSHLRRPHVGADIVENLIVGQAESAADRGGRGFAGRVRESDARREILLLRLRLKERQHTRNVGQRVQRV